MPSSLIAEILSLDNDEVFYTIEMFGGDLYYPLTYGHLDYIAVDVVFWITFLSLTVYLVTLNIFEPVEETSLKDDGITPYPGDMIV